MFPGQVTSALAPLHNDLRWASPGEQPGDGLLHHHPVHDARLRDRLHRLFPLEDEQRSRFRHVPPLLRVCRRISHVRVRCYYVSRLVKPNILAEIVRVTLPCKLFCTYLSLHLGYDSEQFWQYLFYLYPKTVPGLRGRAVDKELFSRKERKYCTSLARLLIHHEICKTPRKTTIKSRLINSVERLNWWDHLFCRLSHENWHNPFLKLGRFFMVSTSERWFASSPW